MGHQSHIGYVTTEVYGQAVMFRIDRPEIPERDIALTESDWVGERRCPVGSIVKRPKIEAVSVLVGAGSIYRMLPCTEAAAIKAIESSERRPLILISVPELTQIAGAEVAVTIERWPGGSTDPDDEDDEHDDEASAAGGF